MKKIVTVLILLAVVGGGAYYYFSYGKTTEKPQIVKATISQGDVTEVVKATGTLEAIRTVAVGSQVSGIVKAVYVDFNSIVHQGQLLAEIDPSLLEVQVQVQEANVARQEGEIANQQVQLEDARKQLERTQQLFDKQLATQQQLDQAILTVKTRETALDAAKKQLQTVEANLNQAKLNLSYTKIYSPIDGVVVNRQADPGQAIQASMTTPQFFTLATDLRTLKLSAAVDEAQIGKILPGMPVNFTVDTYPGSTFTGTVEQVRLNATTQSNVVTYPVWINVRNPDLRLRPSMTATIDIVVQTAQNVLRVPNQATRFRPTADMFTALGLTPPAAQGGRGMAGANGEGAPGMAAARGGDGAGAAAAAAGGEGRRTGNAGGQGANALGESAQGQAGAAQNGRRGGFGRNGGRGFDPNMTPEERERLFAQFGSGRGGRNGRAGAPANVSAPQVELNADKIDDLYERLPVRPTPATVWVYDEQKNELTSKRITIGISDERFTQILSGDVKAGDEVVTNIVVPMSAEQRQQQQQNIFGGRGGFGGGRGRF